MEAITFSDDFIEICKALHELQFAIGPVVAKEVAQIRTKTGKDFTYKFANLADCFELVREPLHKNGLAVIAGVSVVDRVVTVTSRLLHTSGQWAETSVPLPIDDERMSTAQAVGSAMTFGRRYTLCSLLGIATEDDDGKAAGKAKRPPLTHAEQPPKKQSKPAPKKPHVPSKLPHEITLLGSCTSAADVDMAADRVREDVKAKRPGYDWNADEAGTYKAALDSRKAVLAADPGDQAAEGDERDPS